MKVFVLNYHDRDMWACCYGVFGTKKLAQNHMNLLLQNKESNLTTLYNVCFNIVKCELNKGIGIPKIKGRKHNVR